MINKQLIVALIVGFFSLNILNAQTTMCFKQDHKDFRTLETTKLDGGECAGNLSLTQMKEAGWTIDDIKIDKQNYIYILKRNTVQTVQSEADLEEKILKRLEEQQEQSEEKEELAIADQNFASGAKLYKKRCVNCHGEKGEKIYGLSRALNKLDEDEFLTTLRDYGLGTYDRGQALVMLPYNIGKSDARNVFNYLQKMNNKEAN